jgi:signal transduction histidine kinase/CheY-like chemotaxis protein
MPMEDFAAPPFPDHPQLQWRLALKGRVRRPTALLPLAEHMLASGAGDDVAVGRAHVVKAWALLGARQLGPAHASADAAVCHLVASGDAAARALALDLQAQVALNDGDDGAVLRHALAAADLPESARLPQEWSVLMGRLAGSFERQGKPEEALRWHYRALPMAAASGDPMVHAHALAAVGGLQLSLLNIEEAATLCEQAWHLVRDEPAGYAWVMSAANWAMVLMLQQRFAEAVPLADAILCQELAMAGVNRHQYPLLLGELLAHAGQLERAQALLDRGLALYPKAPEQPLNWVRAQAVLWNAQGQHARALELCLGALLEIAAQSSPRKAEDFDLMRLHEEAGVAHEALGHLALALAAHREAARVERRMTAASMRARRLTMQIQSEVDSARRERDSAVLRERDAAQDKLRLNALNQQLEETSRAKSRFLAAASHDLRQPLHALGLQLAHLRSGVDGAARDGIEQRMERTLGSLTHMFDALLDLSRMDAGVLSPRLQTVALVPLLLRLVDELTPVAQARGLRLALHLVGERTTHSDPALLETMLRNLLANALKYTPRGGVLLALRQRGDGLALQVWDTGVGIAAHEREHIFEEFYQVEPAAADTAMAGAGKAHSASQDRDRTQGLGLGLSIVKRLSALLGHALQLRSVPGRGTRFTLLLPHVEQAAAAEPAGAPGAASHEAAKPHRLRIGVIEDDVEVRDSLAALLRRWGHEVLAGERAADLLPPHGASGGPPGLLSACALDAVISDFNLSHGTRGDTEVALLRQALGSPVPALIVSGDTGAEHLRRLQASGLPWLTKPLQPARLRAWLMGCVGSRSTASGADGP